MLKAKAVSTNGVPLYVLGLSDVNIELLKAGQPIAIDLAELGDKGTIFIFSEPTEDLMLEKMRKEGMLIGDVVDMRDVLDLTKPN